LFKKHDKNLVSLFFIARRDIESSHGERERDRRSVDQSEVKAPGDAVREIRFGVPAANVDGKGWDDSPRARFDRDNGDGDRRQEGSLIGRAPIA